MQDPNQLMSLYGFTSETLLAIKQYSLSLGQQDIETQNAAKKQLRKELRSKNPKTQNVSTERDIQSSDNFAISRSEQMLFFMVSLEIVISTLLKIISFESLGRVTLADFHNEIAMAAMTLAALIVKTLVNSWMFNALNNSTQKEDKQQEEPNLVSSTAIKETKKNQLKEETLQKSQFSEIEQLNEQLDKSVIMTEYKHESSPDISLKRESMRKMSLQKDDQVVEGENARPGDVVELKQNMMVLCDGFLVHHNNQNCQIVVDQSRITGNTSDMRFSSLERPYIASGSYVKQICNEGGDEKKGRAYLIVFKGIKQSTWTKKKQRASPLEAKIRKFGDRLQNYTTVASSLLFVLLVTWFLYQIATSDEKTDGFHALQYLNNCFIIFLLFDWFLFPRNLHVNIMLCLAKNWSRFRKSSNYVSPRNSKEPQIWRELQVFETLAEVNNICTENFNFFTKSVKKADSIYVEGKMRSKQDAIVYGDTSSQTFRLFAEAIYYNTRSFIKSISETKRTLIHSLSNPTIEEKAQQKNKSKANKNKSPSKAKKTLAQTQVLPEMTRKTFQPTQITTKSAQIDTEQNQTDHVLYALCSEFGFSSALESQNLGTQSIKDDLSGNLVKMSSEQPELFRAYFKGSPKLLLKKCRNSIGKRGTSKQLDQSKKEQIQKKLQEYVGANIQWVCFAFREVKSCELPKQQGIRMKVLMEDLTLIGIVGIKNQTRQDIRRLVKDFNESGVTIRVVTDNDFTSAVQEAQKIGLGAKGKASDKQAKGYFQSVRFNKIRKVDQEKMRDQAYKKAVLVTNATQPEYAALVTGLKKMDNRVISIIGGNSNSRRVFVDFEKDKLQSNIFDEISDVIRAESEFQLIKEGIAWGKCFVNSVRRFQFLYILNASLTTMILFIGVFVSGSSIIKPVHLLLLSTIFNIFGMLLLMIEKPSPLIRHSQPYSQKQNLFTLQMAKSVVGQCLYEVFVLTVIIIEGESLLKVPDQFNITDYDFYSTIGEFGRYQKAFGKHYTIFFGILYYFMVSNIINARSANLNKNINIFSELFSSLFFLKVILIGTIFCLLAEFTGGVFGLVSISIKEHLFCLLTGSSVLLVGAAIREFGLPVIYLVGIVIVRWIFGDVIQIMGFLVALGFAVVMALNRF